MISGFRTAWLRCTATSPTSSCSTIGLELREPYLKALDIQKELARRDPTRLTFKSQLALTYHNLLFTGNRDEKEAWCQQSLELRKQHVDQDPTNVLYRRNVARSYQALSAIQFEVGRSKDALNYQEECCRLLQEVVSAQPTCTIYQADLAESFVELADRLRSDGREDEAKTALQKSHATYQKLVHSDPDDTKFRGKLSMLEKAVAASESKAK